LGIPHASDDKGHSAVVSCRVEPEFDAQLSRLSQEYKYPTRGDYIREVLSEGAKIVSKKHDDPEAYSWIEEFDRARRIKLMVAQNDRRRNMAENLKGLYYNTRDENERQLLMQEMKALSILPGMQHEFDHFLNGAHFD
jgi:hypothetical protein